MPRCAIIYAIICVRREMWSASARILVSSLCASPSGGARLATRVVHTGRNCSPYTRLSCIRTLRFTHHSLYSSPSTLLSAKGILFSRYQNFFHLLQIIFTLFQFSLSKTVLDINLKKFNQNLSKISIWWQLSKYPTPALDLHKPTVGIWMDFPPESPKKRNTSSQKHVKICNWLIGQTPNRDTVGPHEGSGSDLCPKLKCLYCGTDPGQNQFEFSRFPVTIYRLPWA